MYHQCITTPRLTRSSITWNSDIVHFFGLLQVPVSDCNLFVYIFLRILKRNPHWYFYFQNLYTHPIRTIIMKQFSIKILFFSYSNHTKFVNKSGIKNQLPVIDCVINILLIFKFSWFTDFYIYIRKYKNRTWKERFSWDKSLRIKKNCNLACQLSLYIQWK